MLRLERERMNRFWHMHVEDKPGDLLEAVTHYVDPWYEVRASLVAEPVSYRVEDAVIEVLRTPEGKKGTARASLEAVRGAIAYAGIGRRVSEATRGDESRLQAGLLMECAKALRQARLFVWHRRGIDPADHFELIQRILQDSCIYFTTPEAMKSVLRPKALDEMTKWDVLFSRHKYCLMARGDRGDNVTVGLSDSYHEMSLQLEVKGEQVGELEVSMLRAPHDECFLAPRRSGHRLRGALTTEGPAVWERRLAGAEGCAHLADLAREALTSLCYWRWVRHEVAGVHGNQEV